MKTKTKIFKLQNVVIIAFLALLGFTSCQKEEKKCKCNPHHHTIEARYGVLWTCTC